MTAHTSLLRQLRHLLLTNGTGLLRRPALVVQHVVGALPVDVSAVGVGALRHQQFLRPDVVHGDGEHQGRDPGAGRGGVGVEGLVVQ